MEMFKSTGQQVERERERERKAVANVKRKGRERLRANVFLGQSRVDLLLVLSHSLANE